MARNPSGKNPVKVLLLVLIVLMIAATGLMIYLCIDLADSAPAPTQPPAQPGIVVPTQPETQPPETTPPPPPDPESVVSTATVGAMGDLMMHMPTINAHKQSDGSYNFDPIFQYMEPYLSPMDYTVANLETTLAGTAKPYNGYPMFNCPDELATAAANAGFDGLLTANNHCFDTQMGGFLRTLEVVRAAGLDTMGTMASGEEPKYLIKDVGGIQIGMLAFTYETSNGGGSYPSLNNNPMYGGSYDLINCFVPSAPQRFYDQVAQYLEQMKQAGAEATVMFIHWGTEYQTSASENQRTIAQKLCDLGIDVIIGSHPHVVQPVELLTSTTDPSHSTVCLYSLGNAVSNQRKQFMDMKTGHTEDGVLFSVTFEKYSDGQVYLRSAQALPTWVNMFTFPEGKQYNVVPLDMEKQDQWKDLFRLDDSTASQAEESYQRTQEIIGTGMEQVQQHLDQAKIDREQHYLDLALASVSSPS